MNSRALFMFFYFVNDYEMILIPMDNTWQYGCCCQCIERNQTSDSFESYFFSSRCYILQRNTVYSGKRNIT